MEYKYLQSFLDARLFTIAEENSNYQFITATIPLFKKVIAKNRGKIISATLVALDQNIPQDDPILDEVEGLLKKNWPLVRNKYTDRPITLLRAIILESLYILMLDNTVIANIIWLTGSNFFFFTNANSETPILHQWLKDAGELAEKNAIVEWELSNQVKSINIPDFTLGKISFTNVTFDKAGLIQGLNAAAMNGQQLTQNQGDHYGRGNVFGNIKQEWSTEFSSKAAESFLTVFSKAFETLTSTLNTMNIDKPINDFFTSFKDDLAKTLSNSVKSSEKLRLRSDILWWKEALYSVSLQKSYRDMGAEQASFTMALDLANDTPAIYPVSIDYILSETVLSCLGADSADKTIDEILKQLVLVSENMPHFTEFPEQGRVSFGAFVAGLISKKTTIDKLLFRTGISQESKITYGRFAVLLFRDIQALQINVK